MPLYSTHEKSANRWLVYASKRTSPRVEATKRWDEPFCSWDELQVSLPRDAILVEASERAKGWNFYRRTITRPLDQYIDRIAIGTTILTLLWGILRPVFSKSKEE